MAVVAGTGLYAFLRRVVGLSFWPSAIAAWSYPLTGFFILWQGFYVGLPVAWLPWLLLAVWAAVKRPDGWGGVGVAATTMLVVGGGQQDVGGQVLLTSALFAVWCFISTYHGRWLSRAALGAVAAVVIGWGTGIAVVAPDFLPAMEYTHSGARLERRRAGAEERPPIGLAALPQVVLPFLYGSMEDRCLPMFPEGQGNLQESSAGGYAGILAALLLVPLAWSSRQHRWINGFFLLMAGIGLSWSLNVPGMVQILRLPGLNMMSHNRFVFATGLATVVMAAIGLETLRKGVPRWQRWHWVPCALFGMVALWAALRCIIPPEPIATKLTAAIESGSSFPQIHSLEDVEAVKSWFACTYAMSFLLAILGVGGWLLVYARVLRGRWALRALGALGIGELLWFGCGRATQCAPSQYYPSIPALEAVAKSAPGRAIGYSCLPARLLEMYGLRDVRGYDAVDPAHYVQLATLGLDPAVPTPSYAVTLGAPKGMLIPPDSIRLSPVFDLLGVRYVIFRGTPDKDLAGTPFCSPGFYALVNRSALPRVSVPQRVEMVTNAADRLARLGSERFDGRKVAYVETPVALPEACRGTAEIVDETPTQLTVSARMETAGLLMLADLWNSGWSATVNGRPTPILRTNHALRGVVLPAGAETVVFRYRPAGLVAGLWFGGVGAAVFIGWCALLGSRYRRAK